jgi:hypothetical protein
MLVTEASLEDFSLDQGVEPFRHQPARPERNPSPAGLIAWKLCSIEKQGIYAVLCQQAGRR